LTAVSTENMERKEEELLALVKSWMGHVPVPALDILIIDEIGKNISGAGLDTKVANRSVHGLYNPWPNTPVFERVFIRDLSSASYGNGVGLGMADVVHDRLLAKIDWNPTHINSLTASTPAAIRTPIHFPSDRECLEKMLPTVGKLDLKDVTFGWIRNTLDLSPVALSENLLPQIKANPILEILGDAVPMEFDSKGDLISALAPAAVHTH
jgi:hypothetical protein